MSEIEIAQGQAGSTKAAPAKAAPAKTAKLLEIIVVRGSIHHGAVCASGGHARDRQEQAFGPGDRVKLPEDEARALVARGFARLPDAPGKAEAVEAE